MIEFLASASRFLIGTAIIIFAAIDSMHGNHIPPQDACIMVGVGLLLVQSASERD